MPKKKKQKKFRVCVTRNVTMSVWLTVEAKNAEEADDKAIEIAKTRECGGQLWEVDEGSGSNESPYTQGPAEAEEVEDDE